MTDVAVFQDPDLLTLFETYTASPTSIGAHYAQAAEKAKSNDPLIVATGSDIALYPGSGAPPMIEGFRLSTRGFKEMAGVSHLGPAMATLARLKELDDSGVWRADAEALLASTRCARAANTEALWRDAISVAAFAGREAAIASMIDYSCRITERVLERALADDAYLTAAHLRADYFDGPADDLPVPFNRVMVATFFLTGMDISCRLINWFDEIDLDWERAMVIVAGRAGRPTSGVTRDSNSVAGTIEAASRGRLPAANLLIAPHAPVFSMFDGTNLDEVAALEHDYRLLWAQTLATFDLGELMFAGYPCFRAQSQSRPTLTRETRSVDSMPAISSPTDWVAMTTRLRVVLEDPRQLLSGAVTDYAAELLIAAGNDPLAVTVPGLDGEPYPKPTDRDSAIRNQRPTSRRELSDASAISDEPTEGGAHQ